MGIFGQSGKMLRYAAQKEAGMGWNGEQVAKLRRSMRLSASALATGLGVHRGTIARWESGNAEPTERDLMAIRYLKEMGLENRTSWIAGMKKRGLEARGIVVPATDEELDAVWDM